MIFKKFSPKNSAKILAFFTQNKAKFWKKLIITLVFKKNANFFRQKLGKIAKNCDHNIDPRSPWFWAPHFLGRFLKAWSQFENVAFPELLDLQLQYLSCNEPAPSNRCMTSIEGLHPYIRGTTRTRAGWGLSPTLNLFSKALAWAQLNPAFFNKFFKPVKAWAQSTKPEHDPSLNIQTPPFLDQSDSSPANLVVLWRILQLPHNFTSHR
jgi:hypothetical protein